MASRQCKTFIEVITLPRLLIEIIKVTLKVGNPLTGNLKNQRWKLLQSEWKGIKKKRQNSITSRTIKRKAEGQDSLLL